MTSTNKEGFNLKKFLATYDRRYVFLLLMIIIIGPLLSPIGLPISISQGTVDYNAVLNELGPDDIVLVHFEIVFASYREIGGGVLATMKTIIDRGAKMCLATGKPEGPGVIKLALDTLEPYMKKHDYQYMRDYITIGYVFAAEASFVTISEDFHSQIRTDWKGNSIAGTFLDKINTGADWSLISCHMDSGMEMYLQYFALRWGTPLIGNVIGVTISRMLPYLDTGLLKALLQSTRGGAELEFLISQPGIAMVSMDSFTLAHYMLIVLIILGNIGYFTYTIKEKHIERTALR